MYFLIRLYDGSDDYFFGAWKTSCSLDIPWSLMSEHPHKDVLGWTAFVFATMVRLVERWSFPHLTQREAWLKKFEVYTWFDSIVTLRWTTLGFTKITYCVPTVMNDRLSVSQLLLFTFSGKKMYISIYLHSQRMEQTILIFGWTLRKASVVWWIF